MDMISYLIPAAVIVWIIARQFVGRFASDRRSMLLPLVLIVLGIGQAASAGIHWDAAAVALVAADLVLTVGLGAVRGRVISLSVRDGYLYQRGGVPSLLLWLLSIGIRVGIAVLAAGTAAGDAATATLALSFGVSIAVQYVVTNARVRADGRPIRPARDRRGVAAGSTLDR